MTELPSRTIIPFPAIISWLESVASKKWRWTRNTSAKYVTIRIDTRTGAYAVEDRDGRPMTLEKLLWQYSAETPERPAA